VDKLTLGRRAAQFNARANVMIMTAAMLQEAQAIIADYQELVNEVTAVKAEQPPVKAKAEPPTTPSAP